MMTYLASVLQGIEVAASTIWGVRIAASLVVVVADTNLKNVVRVSSIVIGALVVVVAVAAVRPSLRSPLLHPCPSQRPFSCRDRASPSRLSQGQHERYVRIPNRWNTYVDSEYWSLLGTIPRGIGIRNASASSLIARVRLVGFARC